MRNFDNLMPISKFAELCGVSRQTLIYYDKIGIFHPGHADEKGYRFYSLLQHEEFSLISMLAELDTPLEEIKNYLEYKNAETFLSLLKQKEQAVTKKINKLNSISRLIKERQKITGEALEIVEPEKVTFNRQPEAKIILSKPIEDDDPAIFPEVVSELDNLLKRKNIETYEFGAIVKKENLVLPFDYKIAWFYTTTYSDTDGTTVKPEGLYASTCHRGNYDTIGISYRRLLSCLSENGWLITGDSYETDLLGSYTQKNENEYLTRVSIPVKKKI